MTSEEFRQWRAQMHWSQQAAAQELGVNRRTIQLWEAGERDGRVVTIPRSIDLACHALTNGFRARVGAAAHDRT